MKKFRISLVISYLFLGVIVKGQPFFELSGGLNYNSLSDNPELGFFEELSAENGIYFSVVINYSINERFGLVGGVQFVQKNYKLHRRPPFQSVFKEVENDFLQTPIALEVRLLQLEKIIISFQAGFFASYWIQSYTEGTIPNAFNSTNSLTENGEVIQNFSVSSYKEKGFDQGSDNRLEIGTLLGLDLIYAIHSKYSMVLAFTYNYAFTSLSKSLDYSNRTLVSSIGVRYSLTKGKGHE